MPDLTDFLLARVAEDEQAAERLDLCPYAGGDPGNGAMHLSSRRVLAECEAKRRIVELHHDRTPADIVAEYREDGEDGTPTCAECSCYGDCVVELPCPTLRILAAVYADHPQFDPSWRVE